MAVIETNLPTLRSEPGLWTAIRLKLSRLLKLMQYSRMVSVMANLTDEQLAQIGVERRDIPTHASNCIYGNAPKTPETGA